MAPEKNDRASGTRTEAPGWSSWVLVVVALALVVTVVLAVKHRTATREKVAAADPDTTAQAVPDSIMKEFESIPPATWAKAGTKGATMPTFVGGSDTASGRPVVLYIGAGYCPYCAAARWSIIASLSRFGKFSGLTFGESSVLDVFPGTPTFSFYGSHYTSPYFELQTVELESSKMVGNGQYQRLQKTTPTQEALIKKYDAPPYVAERSKGGIPFILVGGRYMWSGSPYSPELLADWTQPTVAAWLPTGTGDAAQAILANGNMMTATICAVDGNKPADVCSEPVIRKAIEALPHKVP